MQTVEEINAYLVSKGAWLGGSRQKLNKLDVNWDGDWDWQVQAHPEDDWLSNKIVTDPEFNQWILDNCETEENPQYPDSQFRGLWKHKDYPEITLILRNDLEFYIQVFEAIPKWFWHQYLWKRSPFRDGMSDEDFKQRARDIFDVFYEFKRNLNEENRT